MNYEKQRRHRWQRMKLTFIAKKFVAWIVATIIFLAYVGPQGWGEWLIFTAAVFAIDAYSKQKVNVNDRPYRPEEYP